MTSLTGQGSYVRNYTDDQHYFIILFDCRRAFEELWPMKLFDLSSLNVDW